MEYILMDLDGTITNSKLGITKSVQYALRNWNISVEDLDTLSNFIGPPLKESFMTYYGFDEKEAEKAVSKYREYFKDTGIYENEVYEGLEEQLQKLKTAGKRLIVATSKPEVFAKRIMEHFHLDQYYDNICGATMDGTISKKADVIQLALKNNGVTDYSKAVMVGDRKHDIEGAKEVGIASIGVLYGFGSREELIDAGADYICETVDSLYHTITMI